MILEFNGIDIKEVVTDFGYSYEFFSGDNFISLQLTIMDIEEFFWLSEIGRAHV